MRAEVSHRFWILVIAFVALCGPSPGATPDIRVVQSDARGITVEYVPSFDPALKIHSQGHDFLRYTVDRGFSDSRQAIGGPDALVRSVLLRFPGSRGNIVAVLSASYKDESNVLLQPVPTGRRDKGMLTETYIMNPREYSKDEFTPNGVASVASVGETQGVFLGNLLIHPYQYNPARRIIRKYTRIVVRVSFGNQEPAARRIGGSVKALALNDGDFGGSVSGVQPRSVRSIQNSVLASGSWYQFSVTTDGLYKLTGRMLLDAGIPASVDPHDIRIFSNGGRELPTDPTAANIDDLIENAVYAVDVNSNNQLDASDYILFYGKGMTGWDYQPAGKTFSHYVNRYSTSNVYWLTYGATPAKSMTSVPAFSQPATFSPLTVGGKLFREDDKVNILGSGLNWLGQSFNPGDGITYVHPLPTIDASQPVRYRFLLGAQSTQVSTFTVDEHGTNLVDRSYPPTIIDGDGYYGSSQFMSAVSDVTLNTLPSADKQAVLRFSFSTLSPSGIGFIDWYEIFYRQFLQANNNSFNFHSDDTSGTAQYNVSGFSDTQVFVFDVTKFDSVVVLANPSVSSDTCSFRTALTSGAVKEFWVVGQSGFMSPPAPDRVANQNLHGDTTQTDEIIIAHSDFIPAAQRLQTFRDAQDSVKAQVVDVGEIYNEFGGGVLSPVAIRNYLRYAYTMKNPRFVLLFGDGDYDYRRILTTGPDWIPPWESEESFVPINSYASDDYFTVFDASGKVKMGAGRMTARSAQDADAMVSKIISYETNPAVDPWKILATFVADDGPAGGTENDGFIHTWQAESLSVRVPSMMEQQKIYEYEYPTIETAVGRRKPDVNKAIDDQINQGTLILNFTGHGNPEQWAHEDVFERDVDFQLLHNKQKYFFLVAATCNYSYFDALTEQSGGELLFAMPDAGAIAVFSATRAVYSFDNFALNETLYQNLFQVDTSGRLNQQRLGDVIYRTKQVFADTVNDRKYFLLGDPATRISFPRLYASVDTLNRSSLSSVVQLKALSQDTVSATLRPYASYSSYAGQAQLVVYDANSTVQIYDQDYGYSSFTKSGNILFRGQQSVTAGKMKASFVVPKDISYRNAQGRITLYFSNSTGDGVGSTTNIIVGGTDSTAPADNQGPTVTLYLDSRTFRPGDVVSASPTLIADMADEHGINTSDFGVGHRIEAWLDKNPQSVDLTSSYKSATDTYRQGTVLFQLQGLAEGNHSIRVRAWDTYNNPSVAQTTFDVVTGVGLKLSSVYNYPNPFSASTVFMFQHNQLVPIDAQVKIYTVAGRLIQSLHQTDTHQAVSIPWDGRDKEGDRPANGVYLYKLIVKTVDGRFSTEALGKLAIVR